MSTRLKRSESFGSYLIIMVAIIYVILVVIAYSVMTSYGIYGFLAFVTLSISWYYYSKTKSIWFLLNVILSALVIFYGIYILLGSI